MRISGRIAASDQGSLSVWDPSVMLNHVPLGEARYSKGFLAADPLIWVPDLLDHWRPLFHSLGLMVEFHDVERGFNLPNDLVYCAQIDIDDENALIGLNESSGSCLAEALVPGVTLPLRRVLLDYLMRRISATIQRSWSLSDSVHISYMAGREVNPEEFSAAIQLYFSVDGKECSVCFGVGSQILGSLDAYARKALLKSKIGDAESVVSDRIHTVSFYIAELSVPPAMLIDYMRSGTLIDLQVPASDKVFLAVDGEVWGAGELCLCNNSFAVRMDRLLSATDEPPEGTTTVRVEIAEVELDEESLIEHGQKGAILTSGFAANGHASLIIGGEEVAEALIGVLGSNFALSVLPK